ncbi:zinc metalloproteinase-disintegrin-like MTP8 isoform X2 [Tubulanus polymorphus]|uniref:zinc metalloproteinase-disintegrin-like MTP8 isoform X2 n=1 Tax=Tubulanus polymorphus TaxID=672921 RepID=UPI003DA4F3F7
MSSHYCRLLEMFMPLVVIMAKLDAIGRNKAIYLFLMFVDYLANVHCSSSGPSRMSVIRNEFHYYETVIPDIYNHRHRRDISHTSKFPEKISIRFSAFQKEFDIHLEKNRELFSNSYIEKHFTNENEEVLYKPDNNTLTDHCYYHGKIQDKPNSVVALSTCDGVNGYIDDGSGVYYIHQDSNYSYNQTHFIFRHEDMKSGDWKCGTEDAHTFIDNINHHKRLKRSIHGPYDANAKTRYVELYVVNDKRQFDAMNRDLYATRRRAQDIINVVNALYRPLNMYIALVGVETWSYSDRIIVSTVAEDTMNHFLEYRKRHINTKHRNDNSQLLTGYSFKDGVVGKAVKGPICTYQYSGGVNVDHHGSLGPVSTTVAHEMGHNFGMEHDTGACKCDDTRCIMASTSGGTNPRHWSSCSKQYLADAFEVGMDYCLRNKPEKLNAPPLCGNGFVEEGEQCDCGTVELCTNNCCNATTCLLQPQAQCATGACCDKKTCKLMPRSTVCREVNGECDLPEYCDGKGEYCPVDVYKANGLPCKNDLAYCYNGTCPTHDSQCKLLWGNTGSVSPSICFSSLNKEGIANGNCGFHWDSVSFSRCATEDVMCGMLHCDHRNEKLMFWKKTFVYLMGDTFLGRGSRRIACKYAILDVGLDMPDPGMTPSGTKCGEEKLCVNHKCQSFEALNYTDCPFNCSNNGVCNSNRHCHCDPGYGYPYCNVAGDGGSQDSGPAGLAGSKSLLIGMLVLFLLILPLLAVISFFAYRNREALKRYWQNRSQKYLSTSNNKPSAKGSVPKVNFRPHPKSSGGQKPVQRTQSMVGREISTPVLQSSTMDYNNKPVNFSHSAHIPDISRPMPARTAPPPPGGQRGPSQQSGIKNSQLHSASLNSRPQRPPPIKHLQGEDAPAYQNIPRPPRNLKSGHISLNLESLPESELSHDPVVYQPPPRPPRVQSLNYKNNSSRVKELREMFGGATAANYENTDFNQRPSIPAKPKVPAKYDSTC